MNRGARRLILFTAAEQSYALPAGVVSEILPIARLTRPPGLREEVIGLLALDACMIPVIDLGHVLGGGKTKIGLYTPLLVLKLPSPVALLVDSVREMAVVPDDALLPITAGQTCDHSVAAELRLGGQSVHLLDLERLMAQAEPGGAR